MENENTKVNATIDNGNTKVNANRINARSFIVGLIVVLVLMIFSYVLTFLVPSGQYTRVEDADGNRVIDTSAPFTYVDGGLPFWKFLLSPVLVLGSEGSGLLIAILAFLLVVGGVFKAMNACGAIGYLLSSVTHKYASRKYTLMAILILLFMAMGSFIGSFEETIPFVPIIVALAVSLGWDVMTGISMSLVAAGCGFACGIMNPFSTGVAQKIAGLSMFSGAWLRIVSFVLIYGLLFGFTYIYAKKREKASAYVADDFVPDESKAKAIRAFVIILAVGIAVVISSAFITALQDYTMIIIAVMFLVAGVTASVLAGLKGKALLKTMGQGAFEMLPAILMILMASSIKYILTESLILDTVMHFAITALQNVSPAFIILFIYLIALVFNFFIPSASAKAFLLIPLLVPIAVNFGVSAQLCVVAYAFGDGFSNVFYPTNPGLLVALGLSDADYPSYFKFAWKFQLSNLVLTSLILLLGYAVGY